MSGFTNTPYKSDVFIVKQYGEYKVKIVYCPTVRESGWEDLREKKQRCTVNTEKLSNSLSRSKSKVQELALCNLWDYWCTFTIDPQKFDRTNLSEYYSKFSKFINDYNKRRDDEYRVKYLLVPEKHKDGCWHMHGFIKGIAPHDLYVNKYGYLTWKQYENKFGFISMDKIKDLEKASSYIQKYMTKDLEKSVTELNHRIFYSSHGLNKAQELYRGNGIFSGLWDWEHEDGYCKIKNLDLRKDDISEFLEII